MNTKALIVITLMTAMVLGWSHANAQSPISAEELIETTELKQSLQQLKDGEIVLLTRPELESDSELHVAMSLLVPAPLKATVDKMQRQASSSDAPGIITVQGIKETATSAELTQIFNGVAFGPGEAEEVEYLMKAGEDGGYNLSREEIALVEKGLKASGTESDDLDARLKAASETMQKIMYNRYLAYRQLGLEGLADYQFSETKQVAPSEELLWATESMAVLQERFPKYYECVRNYPQQCSPNLINQFFWVKQSDGNRPMFVLKHWVLDVQAKYALITERQYYLSHSLNSMQVVIACLPYGDKTLVVLLNQAFTEKVNRRFGKIIAKKIGYNQVEKNIRPIFEALRAEFVHRKE